MLGRRRHRTTRRRKRHEHDHSITPSGITGGATAVAAGESQSCAAVDGGGKCWGDNLTGRWATARSSNV